MVSNNFGTVMFGISMAVIWSVVFVYLLKSPSGIAAGILFGVSMAASFTVFQRLSSKKNDEDDNITKM